MKVVYNGGLAYLHLTQGKTYEVVTAPHDHLFAKYGKSSVIGPPMDTSPILNLNVILLKVIRLGKMETKL